MQINSTFWFSGLLWLSAAWPWACAHPGSGSGHAAQAARVQAAVAAAQAARVAEAPIPAQHLRLAQEAQDRGNRLHAEGRVQGAQEALDRAYLDARLALTLMQETAARARAEELHDRYTDLVAHLRVSGLAIDPLFEGGE